VNPLEDQRYTQGPDMVVLSTTEDLRRRPRSHNRTDSRNFRCCSCCTNGCLYYHRDSRTTNCGTQTVPVGSWHWNIRLPRVLPIFLASVRPAPTEVGPGGPRARMRRNRQ